MLRTSENWVELLNSYNENPYGIKKDRRIDDWNKIISSLPKLQSTIVDFKKEILLSGNWKEQERKKAKELLLELVPWRKGPFEIGDIFIDAEWRSNLKWERFLKLNIELSGKIILDVGSGNGYYGLRMLGQGADSVVCLEPNLSHLTQFIAINNFIQSEQIRMIPERIEELTFTEECFDLIFSMGVLYHQREPEEHLKLLCSHLKEEGTIIVETLIVPEEYGEVLIPEGNYANMPNVRFVHTKTGLEKLAKQVNLNISSISSACKTTTEEQRTTSWMPFKSLSDGLNFEKNLTIEGFPTPERVFFTLNKNNF